MPRHSTALPILLAATLFFTFVFIASARNWNSINHPCLEFGDYASNALSIENAKAFQQTAGPYSRFKFQHPGPLYFYYLAMGELVLMGNYFPWHMQSHLSAHNLSQIVLNSALLFVAGCVVALCMGRIEMGLLFVLLQMLYLTSLGEGFWINTWGPTVIVVPIVLCIVSAGALASGNAVASFPMMLGAGIATQTHVGTIPLLAPLLGVALARWGYLIHTRNSPLCARHIATVLFACLLLFALYIPTFVNLAAYGDEGGVYHLIAFFVNKRATQHSMAESLTFLSQFYTLPVVDWLPPAAWMTIPLAGLSILRLKQCPLLYELRMLLFLSVPLSVVSISRVVGPLESYLMWFQFGIAGLVTFVIIGGVLSFAGGKLCHLRHASQLSGWALAAVILMGVACFELPRHSLCASVTEDSIIKKLAPDRKVMYGISLGNRGGGSGPWDTALSLALALRRGGYEFCVHHRIRFMFGDRASCSAVRHIDFDDEAQFVHLNVREGKDAPEGSRVMTRIGDVVIIQKPADVPKIRFCGSS